MRRNRVVWVVGRSLTLLVCGALLLAGCGQQDLYKPPKSPYQITGRLALPSAPEGVSVLGNHAFVAGGEAGLISVDLTDPSNPRLLNAINTSKGTLAVKAVSTPGATGRTDLAFVCDGTEGIDLFDVTNPDSLVPIFNLIGSIRTYNATNLDVYVPSSPTDPFSLYLADGWRGCQRLDWTPDMPRSLAMVGRTFTNGSSEGVACGEGFAYVADDEMGLAVVDARIPVAMNVVSTCDTPGNARAVAVQSGHAFVADGKDGLVVMSIHEGDQPVIVAHLTLPGDCRSIAVRDGLAFIAAQDGGTHIVDINNPASPFLTGTILSPYATGVSLGSSGIAVISDRTNGLIVLGAVGTFRDITAPAVIANLTAAPRSQSSVLLSWRAPGNDLYYGTARQYDIRYAAAPITEANWDSATACVDEPAPALSGTAESFRVSGLPSAATEYFFALRTVDGASNWSGLSNVVSAVTFAQNVSPTLTEASFAPQGVPANSEVTFRVTYTDADDDSASRADVVISGQAFRMTPKSRDYGTGVVFELKRSMTAGSYEHYFAFDDGNGHAVSTPVTPGPWVGDIYYIGSPETETGRDADEARHLVLFESEYEIGEHEVTQASYDSLMGTNPSHFRGADLPVENVTFLDAVNYCNALSDQKGYPHSYEISGNTVTWNHTAHGYRLPTEAEWERAARGGTTTAFATGDLTVQTCKDAAGQPDPVLDPIGWYCGNAGASTHPIMTKSPITWNGRSLWDMNGNVWEWCWDWYSENGVVGEIDGPPTGVQRVIRGGSWYYFARDCRAAARAPYWPNSKDDIVGFRVARTLP